MYTQIWPKKVNGRDRFEDLSIERGDIKINRKAVTWEDVNCVHFTQERDQWRSLVNTIMAFRAS
jgi:hypothetical protein